MVYGYNKLILDLMFRLALNEAKLEINPTRIIKSALKHWNMWCTFMAKFLTLYSVYYLTILAKISTWPA